MTIFRWGEFTSNAGLTLPFKIELDALTDEDWSCLAAMVAARVKFGQVEGVPRGGLRFEQELEFYRDYVNPTLLIVDDVLTTGGSMERQRAGRDALGVVVFARTPDVPSWIWPMFWLDPKWT